MISGKALAEQIGVAPAKGIRQFDVKIYAKENG